MTTKDEVRSTVEALRTERALKLALEALEECRRDPRLKYEHPYYDKTITAIREALAEQPAQQQQEQGDSNCQDADGCPTEMAVLQRFWRGEPIPAEHYPVWFKPAQQRPQNCGTGYCSCIECLFEPEHQEPVAYAVYHRMGGSKTLHWPEQHSEDGDHNEYQLVPLYASPPASKPWVGLNAEQRSTIAEANNMLVDDDLFDEIEAKLKEKNNG